MTNNHANSPSRIATSETLPPTPAPNPIPKPHAWTSSRAHKVYSNSTNAISNIGEQRWTKQGEFISLEKFVNKNKDIFPGILRLKETSQGVEAFYHEHSKPSALTTVFSFPDLVAEYFQPYAAQAILNIPDKQQTPQVTPTNTMRKTVDWIINSESPLIKLKGGKDSMKGFFTKNPTRFPGITYLSQTLTGQLVVIFQEEDSALAKQIVNKVRDLLFKIFTKALVALILQEEHIKTKPTTNNTNKDQESDPRLRRDSSLTVKPITIIKHISVPWLNYTKRKLDTSKGTRITLQKAFMSNKSLFSGVATIGHVSNRQLVIGHNINELICVKATINRLPSILKTLYTEKSIQSLTTPTTGCNENNNRTITQRVSNYDHDRRNTVPTAQEGLSIVVPIITNVSTLVETVQGDQVIFIEWLQQLPGCYDVVHAMGATQDNQLYITTKPGTYEQCC